MDMDAQSRFDQSTFRQHMGKEAKNESWRMFQHCTYVAFIIVELTFSSYALNKNISVIELQPMKAETDTGSVTVDNESLESQACILGTMCS